jgi:hypothetical protein
MPIHARGRPVRAPAASAVVDPQAPACALTTGRSGDGDGKAEHCIVLAHARDLPHATAGKALIRGALDIQLEAQARSPKPDLAVAGRSTATGSASPTSARPRCMR